MHKLFKNLIIGVLLFVFVSGQIFPGPIGANISFAVSFSSPVLSDDDFELLAIISDRELLSRNNLNQKLERFALDIVSSNDRLNTKILNFDRNTDSVLSVYQALENLYFNENLIGVILVGDIPIPEIEDFLPSMMPYTDFVDKKYIYDFESEKFVKNPNNKVSKAEIWHSVLLLKDGEEDLLSDYFDKSHKYYSGDEKYNNSNNKIFYGDLINQEKSFTNDAYINYQKYLDASEDIAYNRFTANWLKELSDELISTIDASILSDEGQNILNSNYGNDIPDIHTKNLILTKVPNFSQNLFKYISSINDFVSFTGRFDTKDVHSPALLITYKDEFSRNNLRYIGDLLEEEINNVVEKIADKLPINDYSELSGSIDGKLFALSPMIAKTYFRFNYTNEITGKHFLNGTPVSRLSSPLQCSEYLGSSTLITANLVDAMLGIYPSTGVLTKMISQEEAKNKVNVDSSGALVLDFDNSFLSSNQFKNPLDGLLKKDDLIVSVNGERLGSKLNFENAILNSFNTVSNIINKINKKEALSEKEKSMLRIKDGQSLENADARIIYANVGIEFYRDGLLNKKNFTFSIDKDGRAVREDAQGNPQVIVLLSDFGFENTTVFDFEKNSDGAIFTLFDVRDGYDNSAGCNSLNTLIHDDRCFSKVSNIPMKDPAGGKLLNETVSALDDEILNACYFGLPTSYSLLNDGNPYRFVLAPNTKELMSSEKEFDLYGDYMRAIGDFVSSSKAKSVNESAKNVSDLISDLDASKVVLNLVGEVVTLKDFSDYFGIDSKNLKEVARKLLSKDAQIVVPASENRFNKELVLNVKANKLKEISSLIPHREPSAETIARQLRSYSAQNIPIDSPRYLAFLNNDEVKKINYPNLFSISSSDELIANLRLVANQIALLENSYLIFGEGAKKEDYSITAIRDEILHKYLFKIIALEEGRILNDSLKWRNFDLDQKHEYILKNYLNTKLDAFIDDENKPYDAIYLMLNGQNDYFDLNFNKNIQIESDERFENLDQRESFSVSKNIEESSNSSNNRARGNDFVPLEEFLQELFKFVDSFTTTPVFEDCCSFAFSQKIVNEDLSEEFLIDEVLEVDEEGVELRISASVSKNFISANNEEIIITAKTNKNATSYLAIRSSGAVNALTLVSSDNTSTIDGIASFRLRSNGKTGIVNLWVEDLDSDSASNRLSVNVSAKEIRLNSFVSKEFSFDDDFYNQIVLAYGKDFGDGLIDVSQDGVGPIGDDDSLSGDTQSTDDTTGDEMSDDISSGDVDFVDGGDSLSGDDQSIDDATGDGDQSSDNDISSDGTQSTDDTRGDAISDAISDAGARFVSREVMEEIERIVVLLSKNVGRVEKKIPRLKSEKTEIIDNLIEGENVIYDDLGDESLSEEENFDFDTWQKYYFENKYYEKFLTKRYDKWTASLINDSYIAFIPDSSNPFINTENSSTELSNSMKADGESLMQIKAYIYDDNGNIDRRDGVRIMLSQEPNLISFENGNISETVNGVASFYIKAGTKSGVLKLTASSVSGEYPSKETEILLLSGEALDFDVKSSSDSVLLNQEITLEITLKDRFSNIANNDYSKIGVFNNDEISYYDTTNGVINVNISSVSNIVYVFLVDFSLESLIYLNEDFGKTDIIKGEYKGKTFAKQSLSFNRIEKANIETQRNENKLGIKLLDENGNQISYNGTIELTSLNPEILLFENNNSFVSKIIRSMENGVVSEDLALLRFTGKSGSAKYEIKIPNIVSKIEEIRVNPKGASEIEIKSSGAVLYDSLVISAFLKDEFGNVAVNDSSTYVSFNASEASKDMIAFEGSNVVQAKNGVASVQIKSTGKTGTLNLIAKSSEMESVVSLQAKKRIFTKDMEDFAFSSRYIHLLGGAFGNPNQKNNLASEIIFKGDALSVSALSFGEITKMGHGFQDQNKEMLYFSAGNSVGVSNMGINRENLIIWGDATIRIKEAPKSNRNFDSTIGKRLHTGNRPFSHLLEFDFDGDGIKDILAINESGSVFWFKNNGGIFKDMGEVLYVSNEIYSATVIDYNNDGLDDLIVGTKDSCTVLEDCLSLFLNTGAGFERNTLELNISGKAYKMQSVDLNLNGCEDLVVSDFGGNIRIFYNDCINGLSKSFANSYNFGYSINEDFDLSDSLYFYYEGMAETNDSIEIVFSDRKVNYSKVNDSLILSSSKKSAKDKNGNTINLDDKIVYTISLNNTSSTSIKNLSISDTLNAGMTLDFESLKCVDCRDALSFEKSGNKNREYVINGINLEANSSKKISYEMKVNNVPTVDFDIGKGAFDYPFKDDIYPDIYVRPSINENGKLKVIHSKDEILENSRVVYGFYEYLPPKTVNEKEEIQYNEEYLEELKRIYEEDSNFDGVADFYGNSSSKSASEQMADTISDTLNFIQNMRCSGAGCIPTPYNKAFFAPDFSSGDPGIAVFSIVTYPPFIVSGVGASQDPSSIFRFYLSPTLTGSLGIAGCAGNFPNALCLAYAVPLLESLGLCPDSLLDAVSAFADASKSFINDAGLTTLVMDGSMENDPDLINYSGNYVNPDLALSSSYDVNIKIPGYPDFITDWLDAQTDEIFNKLLDLPDLYFIYPDFSTMFSDSITKGTDYSNISSMNDLLRAINSIPLIQIQSKDVVLKIPAISEAEIEKWKRQAYLWLEYEKAQIEKVLNFWSCDMDEIRRNACDLVLLKLGDISSSIEDILSKLDLLQNLPTQILSWKNLEAKYVTQIICYLDAIMSFSSGYLKRQNRIIESWMKMVEDLIRTIKDWKAILDLSVEYQASCDECKNDKFGTLSALLGVFLTIPSPPVIELPKWPDIVFDMSQVRTGVEIVWPNIIFKPEKIKLPDIPVITLPEFFPLFPPGITIDLENLGLNALAELNLPDWIENFPNFGIPFDLPDLPPLPLPQLPDLPRPPKIPSLNKIAKDFVVNIKPIFTILCLLKKGLIPIPEGFLASEIETLTQPSVSATLPFMLNTGINIPSIQYDFVEQIKIIAKLDFGIETNFIYEIVNSTANRYNKVVERFVKSLNNFTGFPLQIVVDNIMKELAREIEKGVQNLSEEIIERTDINSSIEEKINDANEAIFSNEILNSTQKFIANEVEKFEIKLKEYQKEIDEISLPEQYNLIANVSYIDKSHPSLNRSLEDVLKNSENFEIPELEKYQNMQKTLIAYVQNINEDLEVLNENNLERYVAKLNQRDSKTASLNGFIESSVVKTASNIPILNNEILEKEVLALEIKDDASNSSQNNSSERSKGVFVLDNGVYQNVFSYFKIVDNNFSMAYSDLDLDGDVDMVVHSGGEILIKENKEKNRSKISGKVLRSENVSNYSGKNSVNGFISTYTDNNYVRVSFIPYLDAEKYLIEFRKNYFGDIIESREIDGERRNYDIGIENGNYFANIYAVLNNEKISLNGETINLSPQVCADKEAPYARISSTDYKVHIFDTLTIDASYSFDPNGEIVRSYIETMPYFNENNAGLESSSLAIRILPENQDENIFKIGPFEKAGDIGVRNFKLHVVDQSGNSSAVDFKVDVYASDIRLDEKVSETKRVSGRILDVSKETPFSLFRERTFFRSIGESLISYKKIEKIKTESSNINGKYLSNSDGSYLIDDLNLENFIIVLNDKNEEVAIINPKTGNIEILEDGYFSKVVASTEEKALHIIIYDLQGRELARIYPVSASNLDVKIGFSEDYGVSIFDKNIEDEFVLEKFASNDPIFFGSAKIVNNIYEENALIVDSGGNIYLLDESLKLQLKNNNYKTDKLTIEVVSKDEIIAEVVIVVNASGDKRVIVGEKDVPFRKPYQNLSSKNQLDSVYKDVSADLRNILENLYKKDIILGREINGELIFNPQEHISRAEAVRTLLKMLCIIPRPEAYLPESVFYDIEYSENLPFYYPFVKEGFLRKLVEGYLGEKNSAGIAPFKPLQAISKIETAKIILEALDMLGVLKLGIVEKAPPGWWGNYLKIAQNFTSYLTEGTEVRNNFLITQEEGISADREMTRADLMIMAHRVLNTYNCFEVDLDNDGVADYCKEKYGFRDNDADDDNDGLSNAEECRLGTDPFNPDTDNDGVSDGDEVKAGTDPLNPFDFPRDIQEIDAGIEGVYVVPSECNTCPCVSTIYESADVVNGDVFFTVISTNDEKFIFKKSNEN